MDFKWGLIGPGGIAEGKAQSDVMPHERTLSSQRIMDQVRLDAGLQLGRPHFPVHRTPSPCWFSSRRGEYVPHPDYRGISSRFP